jgi:tight adherence protein C
MTELLVFAGLFVTATIVAWLILRSLFGLFFDPPPPEWEDSTPRAPLFGSWTEAIGSLLPMSAASQEAVGKALLRAGFYHRSALIDYRAVRSLLTLVPVLVGLELALLWDDPSWSLYTVGYGLLIGIIGFLTPRAYLNRRGNVRAFEIQRAMPLALDLLALCLKAGIGLTAAFDQVARRMKRTHPILAHELELTHRQAQLRSLGHALRRFAERAQVPEVSTFAYTLAQSEEYGTDAAAALQELSNNHRTALRQLAEAQASRTSFWMLFPTIGCLYVAAAIFLIAPGFLQLIREGQTLQDVVRQTQPSIEEANRTAVSAEKLLRPGNGGSNGHSNGAARNGNGFKNGGKRNGS